MHQVQVNVHQRRLALGRRYDVVIPDLLVEGPTRRHLALSDNFDFKYSRGRLVLDTFADAMSQERFAQG